MFSRGLEVEIQQAETTVQVQLQLQDTVEVWHKMPIGELSNS